MADPSDTPSVGGLGARLLRYPLVRIAVALLAIAGPFALVAIPFNLFVADKFLRKVGALLLTVVILVAYRIYVKVVEKRTAMELSGSHSIRELGAVLEEVVMRGVVFRILEQWLGSWIALVISAAVFGLLHLLNPGVTLLNASAVMMEAGIMLAAAYMLTRRLWFCIGSHFAWNFMQGGVFSAAVSGGAASGLLQAKLVGPVWLTGGTFGIEASVIAVAVCLMAGLTLLFAARRRGNVTQPAWLAAPLPATAL